MRYFLILNFIATLIIFGIGWSGDNRPWLLFVCLSFAVFCNVKVIGFIKKYWNTKNDNWKSVLGAIILSMEDIIFLYPPMSNLTL